MSETIQITDATSCRELARLLDQLYPSNGLHDHNIYTAADGRRFAITDCSSDYSYWDGGTVYGYEIQPTRDHLDLVNMKPSELEPLRAGKNGRFHGRVIKLLTSGGYAILIGPPVAFKVPALLPKAQPTPAARSTPTSIRHAFVPPA